MTIKNNNYKPLVDGLVIVPSDIHGYGVHSTRRWVPGNNLGTTHVWVMDDWVRTPLGGFLNHSDKPNCELIDPIDYNVNWTIKTLQVIREIKPGDELTVYYSLYADT